MPLCFNMAFAVWRDLIFVSTVMCRLFIGLYHMSWSPLPRRKNVQLFFLSISRTFFSYSAMIKVRPFRVALTKRAEIDLSRRCCLTGAFQVRYIVPVQAMHQKNRIQEQDRECHHLWQSTLQHRCPMLDLLHIPY